MRSGGAEGALESSGCCVRLQSEDVHSLAEFVLKVRPYGDDRLPQSDIPVSFFVDSSYWRQAGAQNDWIAGTKEAFAQRLIVHYGLNLYCAACRQIALATTGRADAIEASDRHTRMLLDDRIGDACALRGWSDKAGGWRYGDERACLPSRDGSAYFYSAISDRWRLSDPHTGKAALPDELGGSPLLWSFYDPFLGENSWAALIAPMQVAWLKMAGSRLTADCDEMRLARSLVPACLAMKSSVGGVYARPAVFDQVQERLISNETNLTLYAGLTMLGQMMPIIRGLDRQIGEIERLRAGLLDYFRRHLCGIVDGELRFHACGCYFEDAFLPGKMATGQAVPFAADVHTWGLSILGVQEIDSRHGRGAAYRLWQAVKRHAGYYPDGNPSGPVRGIGYSSDAEGEPVHDVCSPEWTFGAINMCRILAAEYEASGLWQDVALASLVREDEKSMLEGVGSFEMSPRTPFESRAYPYVNRLVDTGFGWTALPVPCLSATAWAILIKNRFNPFRLGGEYLSTPHDASFT